MIKVIAFAKRKSGWTYEDYSRYWYEQHGPLFAKTFPQVKRYVQNHALKIGTNQPAFDGVGEFWFDDLESWRSFGRAYNSEAGKAVRDDEDKFLDKSALIYYVCEEKVIKP